jgi:hypothetical protein
LTDLTGGLITARAANNLPNNAFRNIRNFKYTKTGDLETREGTGQVTNSQAGAEIKSIAYYNSQYIIATADTLYYLDGSDDPVSLGSVDAAPFFVEFNDKLIVCDSGRTKYLDSDLIYGFIGAEGSELITNGTMEADANWTAVGTPSSEGRSAIQSHAGSYSWNVITDAADEGVKGDTFTTETGMAYKVIAWLYHSSGTNSYTIKARCGDDSGFITVASGKSGGASSWSKLEYSYKETGGGSNAYFQITADNATVEFYVDDVSVAEVDGPKSTCGVVRASRLFLTGDSDYTSRVWYSNVNDPDDFTTTREAGYIDVDDGDGGETKVLSLLADTIIIAKHGERRTVHRLDGLIPDEFTVSPVATDLGVEDIDQLVNIGNDVYLSNIEGLISLNAFVASKDFAVANISRNIQDVWNDYFDSNTYVAYFPKDSQVWVKFNSLSDVYVYDIILKAWTKYRFAFTSGNFRHINNVMHIADTSGDLYKLDDTVFQDDGVDYTMFVRSGYIDFGTWRTKLIKWLQPLGYTRLGASGNIKTYKNDESGHATSSAFDATVQPYTVSSLDATLVEEMDFPVAGIAESMSTSPIRLNYRFKNFSWAFENISLEYGPLIIKGVNLQVAVLGVN